MKIAIVYDSLTGTTQRAAQAMATAFEGAGHTCEVMPVNQASATEVARADLICVGSWTRGLLVVGQHATPKTMGFLGKLEDLRGKPAVVFCTYKLATGKTLPKMAEVLQMHGARVVGSFKFRGPKPTRDFGAFAYSLGN